MKNANKKIKILQVCAIDSTATSLLLPLLNRLVKEGYDVEVACSEGNDSKRFESKGYTFRYVQIDRKISLLGNIKSVMGLYKIMKGAKYDIVHTHTPVASVLARIAAKLAKVPLVIYTAHGFYFHDRMSKIKYTLFTMVEKVMGRYFTDYIFTQSQEDYKTAMDLEIIKKEKLLCISNGVDVNQFNPDKIKMNTNVFKNNLRLPSDSIILSFIGRPVKEKGILDLMEAFKRLSSDYANLYLLLIGDTLFSERDYETKEKVESYLHEKNIKDKIILTGRRKDIPELLSISDIFILPSYREGMPRSIIEAMAMGKPVIASNIRGCREEIVDGETGFLVGVNAPDEIYTAVKRLIDDDELRNQFGMNARRRALELYDEEKVLDKEIKVIKDFTR